VNSTKQLRLTIISDQKLISYCLTYQRYRW